jgi:hypothetical protein
MKPKKSSKDGDKDTFESVAKRLECDDDKARFEAKLGKLAKAPAVHDGGRKC